MPDAGILDRSAGVGAWVTMDFPAPVGTATEIPDPRSMNPVKIARAYTVCFRVMMDPLSS